MKILLKKYITICIFILIAAVTFGQGKSTFEDITTAKDSICKIHLILKFDFEKQKYGYVDSTEAFIILPEFYCATEFINCLALTSKNKECLSDSTRRNVKWSYINKLNSNQIMPPRAENRIKWENHIKTPPNE